MGRRKVAAGVGGDSSPSSAESSFRELDDSFLQTQTRIWLEDVLDTRLNEDLHVSDLLQDGEILFELSKVVWNLLLTKCSELRCLRGRYGLFGSKKSSGRYRPYSNVDSFLKICKIMGLKGIDLFSPSDVVEKRDIRTVCICIRALSKRARSKQLSVPDFDMVLYSVSMPKDMVGCIRRSLELSQSTLSSSSSSPKDSPSKLRQKNLCTPSDRDDDSCSGESDEAESRYMGENYFLNPSKFDNTEVNSVLENDHQFDKISSFGVLSRKKTYRCSRNDAVDVVDSNFTSETGNSIVGDSSCISGDESSYIADYLAFSDLMVHAADDRNLVFLDGENKMFDFFLNPDSQGQSFDAKIPHNGYRRKFSDDETEVSSTTSMTSVLCRVLNLELNDQFDTEHEFDKQYQDPQVSSESKKSGTFEASLQVGLFDSLETQSESALSATSFPSSQNACQEFNKEFLEVESFGPCTRSQEVASCMDNAGLIVTGATLIYKNEDSMTVKECKQENDKDIPAEKSSNGRSNASHGIPPWKLGRKALLKTVLKGTAIAGVFFLFMHINGRTSRGNNALATKEYAQAQSKFPSKKPQISRVHGIYPAERIKL